MSEREILTVKLLGSRGNSDREWRPSHKFKVVVVDKGVEGTAFMRPTEFVPWSGVSKIIYQQSAEELAITEWSNAGWRTNELDGYMERDEQKVAFVTAASMTPPQWEESEKKRIEEEIEAGRAALAEKRAEEEPRRRGRPPKSE
jgi:hypothetical protein